MYRVQSTAHPGTPHQRSVYEKKVYPRFPLRLSGRSYVEGTLVVRMFSGIIEVSKVDNKGNVMYDMKPIVCIIRPTERSTANV